MSDTTTPYEAATLITKVKIDGFKNLTSPHQPDGEIPLTNPTFLIGPNGSGKSNLGEALRFVRSILGESYKDDAIWRAVKHHGGLGAITQKHSPDSNISLAFHFAHVVDKTPLFYKCTFKPDFDSLSLWLSYESYPGHAGPVLGKPVLSTDLAVSRKRALFSEQADFISSFFIKSLFYNANNISTAAVKGNIATIDPDNTFLSENGLNIQNVYFLLENSKHYKTKRALEQFITKYIDQDFETIRTPPVGENYIGFKYWRSNSDTPYTLATLSDGTIRMLMWAAVLLHPEPPPLIFIDEPELGLHPEWMGPLMEMIWKAAEKTQVIIATHSPDLLDQLELEDAGHVLVCEQDAQGLAMFHALDPEPLSEWLNHYRLGELYRAGRPEVGGWSEPKS